jgi:hypothetical protein
MLTQPTLRTKVFLVLLICLASFSLRMKTIKETSPAFDEPLALFQGIYYAQQGAWYMTDVHPPMLPWLISVIHPHLGNFQDTRRFVNDPKLFFGPYQYRMDIFSGLPEDESIERARVFFQVFWLVLMASVFIAATQLGMPTWGMLVLLGILGIEPFFVGLASVVNSDYLVLVFLCLATSLCLTRKKSLEILGFCFFTLAWTTKFTAALWAVPLGIGYFLGKVQSRTLWCWALGFVGGTILTKLVWNPEYARELLRLDYRLSFLDGIMYLRTAHYYFVQAFLNKFSLASLALVGFLVYRKFRSPERPYLILIGTLIVASLVACTWILPGIGLRLVLPLILPILVLACFEVNTPKVALSLLALLALESLANRNQLMAYQNPLAGRQPRLLDSNRDWGQGLKQLAAWRRANPDVPLALSLFSGNMPETYGITNYRALPSFPHLAGGAPLDSGSFSGFVAASENNMHGYIIDHPAIRQLAQLRPLHCFQGILCLYDVRERKQ